MGSLHKDPRGKSPYWYCAFTLPNGKRCYRSTKQTSRRKALEICLSWERLTKDAKNGELTESQVRKVAAAIYEQVAGMGMRFPRTAEYLYSWLARVELQKPQSTYKRYCKVTEGFLSFIGEKRAQAKLSTIEAAEIQGFIDRELAEGKTPITALMSLKILKIPFGLALRQGVIAFNPAAAVEIANPVSEERQAFSMAQVKSLLSMADPEWVSVIMLGTYGGLRLGDAANLRWSSIDLSLRLIRIVPEKTKARKKEIVIPLHYELEKHLLTVAGSDDPNGYLTPTLADGNTRTRTRLSTQFLKLMRHVGIDTAPGEVKTGKGRRFNKLSFHSLRHSFNSILANEGVSQEIRQKLTGHTSVEMNTKYTHMELMQLRKAIEKMPKLK